MSSRLDVLPPRPPTPPRESHHEPSALALSAASSRPILDSADTPSSLHTPPGNHSPTYSLTTNSTSRRARKVEFSTQAEYKDPPIYTEGTPRRQHPTPVSLPRSASKPVKSILKPPAHGHNPLDSTSSGDSDPLLQNNNLAAMLESTIQQLAGGDRDSKVDAYMMLTRACKASNNLPDRVALQAKMGLFLQFMQRDIVSRTPEAGIDSSLVNHALNLLITFLGFSAIASTFTNDFGVFIVDHCIRSFEDPSIPKDVARHLMQVIAWQNFSAKVMTADRVGRLVAALHNIENHVTGKSIIMSRVLIYKNLVKQARSLMVIHSDWLFDLFTDMLSTIKEIRSSAIDLGLEAAFSIGHEKQLQRKVMEVLNHVSEEKRYIEYYEERLRSMAEDKNNSATVPPIWSVVILMLRAPLYKLEYMNPWLLIIQSCFNSTDLATKIYAHQAWSRLVYLMHLDERTFRKNVVNLTKPLITQLRRKSVGKPSAKTSEELQNVVFGGICNLFYYTFKPQTAPALLDGYWDSSVKPVIARVFDPAVESGQDKLRHASTILGSLFDCTTPRRWKEDRIVEGSLVKPEELPALDSKWVRRNTDRVFATIQPILEKDFLALADSKSATYRLWKNLVATVASAASKEIKVSKDTTQFVTEALGALQKVWNRGLPTCEDAGSSVVNFLLAARAFVEIMINALGLLPLTEKPGKNQAFTKAPLYSLFSTLSSLPPGVPDDKDFADFYASVFAPFFNNLKSDKAKMDLAQDLLSAIPIEAPRPYGPWLLVANKIASWLEPGHSSHNSNISGSETPIGHEYRDVVKVLERGIRSTPSLPWDHWESLFDLLVERVRDEVGDAGVAIVAIEPLAKILPDQFALVGAANTSANSLICAIELVSAARQPHDRQAVDAARRRLWGTALAGSRSASFDTFDNLYKAASEALAYMYNQPSPAESEVAARLLQEIGQFFERCNRQLFMRTLAALQDGILPWICDCNRAIGNQPSPVLAATKSLWDKICSIIAEIEHPEQQLEPLERVFCASFQSSHLYFVNSGVSLWNKLFQNVEHLEYPEHLKTALGQIQSHTGIVLPGLEMSSAEHVGQQPLFIDSLDDFSLPEMPSTRSSQKGTPRPASGTKTPDSGKQKKPVQRQLAFSPKPKAKGGNRANVTPRLRHDNSQIQFAPIGPSSPDKENLESQVLTDRQKEVRDRQKENAALFPEIRSSPGVKSKESGCIIPAKLPSPQDNSRLRQAATPEPENPFNGFVTSTPTPRRGQPVLIPDHDLNDPPSSPPEPRRNPLAAEIRSRSASHSLLEEWQFSSSPISGSPNPSRQMNAPEVLDRDDVNDEAMSFEADEDLPAPNEAAVTGVETSEPEVAEPEVTKPEIEELEMGDPETARADANLESEVIEDSVISMPEDNPVPAPNSQDILTAGTPTTPRKYYRLLQPQITPRSDDEVFMDAPSSPLPPTPKRSERLRVAATGESKTATPRQSSQVSDVDEKSFLRLVVELDARRPDRSGYRRPSVSLQKTHNPPDADCIVVGDGPKKRPGSRGSSRSTRASSAESTTPSTAEIQVPSSQPQKRDKRQKRKRASSKTHKTSNKKRKQGNDADEADEADEVPDSQPVPVEDARKMYQTLAEQTARASSEDCFSTMLSEDFSPDEPMRSDKAVCMQTDGLGSDDREVQSQIALESRSRSELEETKAAGPESMDVDMLGRESEGPGDAEATNAPKADRVQNIMSLLRGGLDELRTAALSRQEVYQIEDLFMDMKRELYEAEKRGRA